MHVSPFSRWCALFAFALSGLHFAIGSCAFAQRDQNRDQSEVEVLTRGPIHEAFAQTVTFNPEPGITVPKAPPNAIEELPPDQRPAGDNVAWIPGYWGWDDDRNDFLWISGTWRILPPGRQWVPGYWSPVGTEYQWTAGYWADAKQTENVYLPEPPATVEMGPASPASSMEDLWIPGVWVWNQSRYSWQPGYWAPAQQNWVWIPTQNVWTPRGYVSVSGYYDYSVANRGLLFAPVYINSGVYSRRGFRFSPTMALSTALFSNQLFLRPNYSHYYFGDYYGSNYSSSGFYPWFSFNSGGYGYDPIYANQAWQNRQNRGWAKSLQADYQNRVDNEGARPPRSLAAQQELAQSGDAAKAKNLVSVTSLEQLQKSKDSPLKFQPLTKEEQQTFAKQGQAVHQFGETRQKLEAHSAETLNEKPNKGFEPARVKSVQSPIAAKSLDQPDKANNPPKAHLIPAHDPKVEPKPRQAASKGNSPTKPPVTIKAAKPELPSEKPKAPTDKPKQEPKAAPNTDLKPMPKVERKLAPKGEPKSEQKPGTKGDSKPDKPKPN